MAYAMALKFGHGTVFPIGALRLYEIPVGAPIIDQLGGCAGTSLAFISGFRYKHKVFMVTPQLRQYLGVWELSWPSPVSFSMLHSSICEILLRNRVVFDARPDRKSVV